MMKKLLSILLIAFSLSVYAQTSEYLLSSYLEEGFKAPNTNYLSEAWINSVLRSDESITFNITKATFKANLTLNWHKHTDQRGTTRKIKPSRKVRDLIMEVAIMSKKLRLGVIKISYIYILINILNY